MSDPHSGYPGRHKTADKRNLFQRLVELVSPGPDSKDELISSLADAEDREVIAPESRMMLEGVIRMADMTAGDVMVAAPRMDLLSIEAPYDELLHTVEAPTLFPDGFSVSVAPQDRPGHGGGRLEAKVLLPKDAVINSIGGRGFEFFVDDRNYDENGTLQESIRKLGPNKAEPGAWRIEVSPPRDARQDIFLVVLLPAGAASRPSHRVRLLESGKRVGCEIVGPSHTTRWWFEPGRNDAEIEVSSGSDAHRYTVRGPVAPDPAPPSWLNRVKNLFGIGFGG